MLERYFGLRELNTTLRQEILAGATTFLTMIYIIVVNPKILEAAGIPFGPSMVATILTTAFGTFLMGVYAKRPFAIAPYMGQNAFVAYTLVKVMGYPWQVAMGGIFVSGLIFTILTLTNIRTYLVQSVPNQLKIAFTVGLGLFLGFIGLTVSGIVRMGVPDAPVQIGNILQPQVILAILGFLIMTVLMARKFSGAIFTSIMIITVLAAMFGMVAMPSEFISMPPDISPILGQLDIMGALQPDFLPIVLLMFILVFIDTMGTLIGVANKAGFLDKDGNLPEIEKPMLCDSLSTMFGAFLGTSTSGAYIESVAGIETGGRSGLTSVVTAILFLLALFLSPLFAVVPAYAYGPALIVIGMLMMTEIHHLDVSDLTEMIPVLVTIFMITFTYNLGIGMSAGFIIYPLLKLFTDRREDIPPGLWFLSILSLLFFIFYPY